MFEIRLVFELEITCLSPLILLYCIGHYPLYLYLVMSQLLLNHNTLQRVLLTYHPLPPVRFEYVVFPYASAVKTRIQVWCIPYTHINLQLT